MVDRNSLLDQLNKLPDSQWEKLIFRLRVDKAHQRANVTKNQSNIDLIDLFEQQEDGLQILQNALHDVQPQPIPKTNKIFSALSKIRFKIPQLVVERETKNRGLLVLLAVTLIGVTVYSGYRSYRKEQILKIKELVSQSNSGDLPSSLALEQSIRAANLAQSPLLNLWKEPGLETQVALRLTQILNRTHEINRFSTKAKINSIDVSKNFVAAGEDDGFIELWKNDGTPLKGGKLEHSIISVSFNPDETMLVSGDESGQITIWRLNEKGLYSSAPVTTNMKGATKKVQFGKKYLVVAANNEIIKLFDSNSWQELLRIPAYTGSIDSISLSPDEKYLVSIGDDTGSNETIKLWTIEGNNYTESLSESDKTESTSIDFSEHGRELIAAGNSNGKIQIWAPTTDGKNKPLFSCSGNSQNQKGIESIKFSKDGETLASVSTRSEKQILSLWKIQNNACSFIKEFEGDFKSIEFNSNGQLVSGGDDETIKTWDISALQKSTHKDDQEHKLEALAFSSNNSYLAAAYDNGKLKFWTTKDNNLQSELFSCNILDRKISGIEFAPDSNSIIVATDSGKEHDDGLQKRLYTFPINLDSENCNHEEPLHYLENEDGIEAITLSRDGHIIASANRDNKIQLWDFDRSKPLFTIQNTDYPQSLDISPNNQLLALGSTEGVQLWSIDNKEDKPVKLPDYSDTVMSVSFSPDNETLLSLDNGGVLKLWSTLDNTLLLEIPDNQQVFDRIRFNSDKNKPMLAVSIQNKPILWSMKLEELISLGCNDIQNYLKKNGENDLCSPNLLNHAQ